MLSKGLAHDRLNLFRHVPALPTAPFIVYSFVKILFGLNKLSFPYEISQTFDRPFWNGEINAGQAVGDNEIELTPFWIEIPMGW